MPVTANFYRTFKDYLGDGGINLNTADLRVIPLTVTYTFNQAHQFVSSLTGEVTTNGGTRLTLASETWALATNNARLDCEDIAWTASGASLTIRQFALVDYTGSSGDADRELIALFTNDADLVAGEGTQVKFTTPNGLFEIQ
jgi:hypothetical protein